MRKKKFIDESFIEKRDKENSIAQLTRSLKKYCVLSYKQLLAIKMGKSDLVPETLDNGSLIYNLYTNSIIRSIYGQISVTFSKEGLITDIQPYDYLYEGYRSTYILYKNVFIPNDAREKFKVDYEIAKSRINK